MFSRAMFSVLTCHLLIVAAAGQAAQPSGASRMVNLGLKSAGGVEGVTDDMLKALVTSQPDVEQLSIYKGTFTKQGLAALAALPKLRCIAFAQSNVAASEFAPLAEMSGLKSLKFTETPVNDEVLGYVGRIRGLTALEIMDFRFGNLIRVTPAGVAAALEGVDGLEEFLLFGDVVDDRCMERIAQMKDMRRLWVTSRTITPQAWGKLAGMRRMQSLNVRGTTFDDAAMKTLEGMPELEELMLDDTQITDAGMAALAGLTKIGDLGLNNTKITDKGIENLRGMTGLHNLYVAGTQVTVKGLEIVPQKKNMSMMRVGNRPLSADEFAELRSMFERSEIFDPVGYWSPDREKAAGVKQPAEGGR